MKNSVEELSEIDKELKRINMIFYLSLDYKDKQKVWEIFFNKVLT